MVEDKYIGLALAVSSSVAIGTSFIITKKGLNDAANKSTYGQSASESLSYLKNPIWWAGITTLVLGEVANFAAYTFAPAILLGHLGRLGCTLCLLGSLIIVLHAPSDKEGIDSVEVFLSYVVQPGFLLYCLTVLVFSLGMIFLVVPKYGRKNPLVYISICSLVGSISVMAIKGFGIAVKLTFSGNNQFTHFTTYIFGTPFPTNVVNPTYYVGFSTATLVASIILFQGFNTSDTAGAVSLLTGFVVTFLGVHLLNLSRAPRAAPPPPPPPPGPAPLGTWKAGL
ncbi:magnesium transporter NIPA-domain-containing protein [Ephemerocybe angulata]|uniref:Magnesium transporter NIPA-domain-containing protein n=1 Tax=Ephemerocybe angulata TaxID=980116 RepID=A0A8H6I543_9AGAR|nr:magnesium transporter NIPA-domain-containing protein [Tulosesus angulatus]